MATKQKQPRKGAVKEEQPAEALTGAQSQQILLLQFARMDTKVEELKKALKEAQEAKQVLQDRLLREIFEGGVSNITFLGHSVYLHKQLWAKPNDGYERGDLVTALKKNGFGDYVKEDYNTQALSGKLRELEKHYIEQHQQQPREGRKPFRLADYLPKPLTKVLKLEPDSSVRIKGVIPSEELDKLEQEMKINHGNK